MSIHLVENKRSCFICNSKNITASIYPGYWYKSRKYTKYQCKKCLFIFIDPVPDRKTLEEIYNDPDYFNNYFVLNAGECGYLNSREAAIKNAEKTLIQIKKYARGSALLEIGCAGGFFLSAAKNAGFDITGIELNKKMAEIANKELEGKVIHGDISEMKFKERFLDVVYMGDALEHLAECSKITDYVREILRPKGILVIEGPLTYNKTFFNFFLKLKFFFRRGYYSNNPPTHLWEFTPQNLIFFLERHGFKVLYVDLCEKRPSSKKLFKGSLIKSISWYLKIVSAFISNSWLGKKMNLGDRLLLIAAKNK